MAWLEALAWIMIVFAAEVLTGPHFTFEPFYVPAVIYAGWRGGRAAVYSVAGICATLGVIAEHLLHEPLLGFTTNFEHPAIPYWNGVAHLIMYLTVGLSVCALHRALQHRGTLLNNLRDASNRIRTLQGLLPVCAWCKQIHDAKRPGRWLPLDQYVAEHTDAQITHGICPSCMTSVLGGEEEDARGAQLERA